jgi:hypothetical protein
VGWGPFHLINWIEFQTSNLAVAGSSPAERAIVFPSIDDVIAGCKASVEGRLCKRAQEGEEPDRRKSRDRQNDGHKFQGDRGSSLAARPLTRPIIPRLIARQWFPPADVKNNRSARRKQRRSGIFW